MATAAVTAQTVTTSVARVCRQQTNQSYRQGQSDNTTIKKEATMTQSPELQFSRLGAITRKAAIAITLCSALGSLTITPAVADNRNNHYQNQNKHHGNQGNQGRRGWHGEREVYTYRPVYRHPYSYAQPVYVPPPIYYEPRQSPGVSLFFPLDFRR